MAWYKKTKGETPNKQTTSTQKGETIIDIIGVNATTEKVYMVLLTPCCADVTFM